MNPYGIVQVDIPGVLGAYETGQNNRMRRMALRQQTEAAEREAERRARFDEILMGRQPRPAGGAYGMGGASSTAPAAAAATSPVAAAAPDMMGEMGPDWRAAMPQAPQAAPQQAGRFELSPEDMRALAFLDPERAGQIFTALRTMDTSQRERMQAANLYLANAAQHLLANVPEAQWASEIQRITPDLLAHGISQEMIAGFQPTRQNLQGIIQSAMDVERLAQRAFPNFRNVGPGDDVVDLNQMDEQGRPRRVYRSDVIMVNGVPYQRPDTGPERPAPRTLRDRRTGRVIQQNPETGQWEEVPQQTQTGTAPDWPIPGGRASAPGNFPQ